jgi:tetratricopeptide (TPR) repeat protein
MDISTKAARLQEAQNDPQELTLAAVDILLSSREPHLREALEAAAVPHWFNAEILGKLLSVDFTTAGKYFGYLKSLPVLEAFESRGGWNVHEATRLALRFKLVTSKPDHFHKLSALAAEQFQKDEPHQKVERIYHRLAASPIEAEKELHLLWENWHSSGCFEPLQTLATALSELIRVTPLQPVARARALLCYGLIQRDRLPAREVEVLARESLALFMPTGDPQAEVDARDLLGDILFSQGRREEALREYQEYKRIMLDLTKRDPGNTGWLRERSVSHTKAGGILEAEGRREEALREYKESKRIMLDLAKRDPGNTGWLRDLSVSHTNVAL